MTISETTESPQTSLRTYEVRTFGCQMNVHDSERMAGLLEASGYVRAAEGEEPDLVVFNTCAVRENASNRLYGHLGQLASVKRRHEGMQMVVRLSTLTCRRNTLRGAFLMLVCCCLTCRWCWSVDMLLPRPTGTRKPVGLVALVPPRVWM